MTEVILCNVHIVIYHINARLAIWLVNTVLITFGGSDGMPQ